MTNRISTDELRKLLEESTPGPWTGHNMIHADHGRQMMPEEIGEYVCNSVKMGDPDRFLFVSAPHEDGGTVDVCHTGNGPKGQFNTILIAAVPDLAAEVIRLREALEPFAKAADGRKSKNISGSHCFVQDVLLKARAALNHKETE